MNACAGAAAHRTRRARPSSPGRRSRVRPRRCAPSRRPRSSTTSRASTASCPDTESPADEDDRERERRHEQARPDRAATTRNTRARTSAKASVITTNAVAEPRLPRSARGRRRGSRPNGSCNAPPSAARTPRSRPAVRRPPRRRQQPRCSVRAGGGTSRPRRTISRSPSAPIVSASPRNQSQRTTCSSVVGPPAPYASATAGAGTPTPNVQTPETTCESAEIACQRTVYVPRGSGRTWAMRSVPRIAPAPAKSCPSPFEDRDRSGQRASRPGRSGAGSSAGLRCSSRPETRRGRRERRVRRRDCRKRERDERR